MEIQIRAVHTCDGCDKMTTGRFPFEWLKLRVYQRTEASAGPIYKVGLTVCSTSCGTRALMRYHESVA